MKYQFNKSLSKENKFIQERKHEPVLKQLNKELASEHKVKLDHKTYKEYYGNSKEEKEKNKLGIDADCDLIHIPTSKVIIQAFALDYKIRFTAYYPLDFLGTGFKHRNNNANLDASGNEYVYMAWADTPAKYSVAF